MAALLFSVILATMAIGLLEGSEIAMMMVAAASKFKWRTAWRAVFGSLLTLVPILVFLYFFFTVIPAYWAGIAAGVVIFILGAHFFMEGLEHRKQNEKEEHEDEKISASLIGVYAAMVLEEIEAGGISMSVAVAAGGAYISAILGMLIGLCIPLIAVKRLEPVIEKIPEWMVQLAVGSVMMLAALFILIYHI